MKKINDVKDGEKVYDKNYGDGIVIDVNEMMDYPISVNFNGIIVSYTLDGKEEKENKEQCLFFKPNEKDLQFGLNENGFFIKN